MRATRWVGGGIAGFIVAAAFGAWRVGDAPLLTRWAADVSPEAAWPEYPRPQMVRETWLNLNGLWQYAVRERAGDTKHAIDSGAIHAEDADTTKPRDSNTAVHHAVADVPPESWDGEILVPFPIESALSGVMRLVMPDQRLWYRRTFEVPRAWAGRRVLLHFGAVDWEATVTLNGHRLGTHRGGYDPFTFDITPALRDAGPQELIVEVFDPTDTGDQPRGKQVLNPESIWYTPTTGIWQTVWLEPVPDASIERLRIEPNVDQNAVEVAVEVSADATDTTVALTARTRDAVVATAQGGTGEPITLRIPSPRRWSPEDPFLYDLDVVLKRGDAEVDRVGSYFGMRKISVARDAAGIPRLMLNDAPTFQIGPLDQGFWPDGLYTAPTDAALRYDIETTRRLGFNLIRKHVKVEPDRWYYWCDRLGVLVWQDMPSGDAFIGGSDPDVQRKPASAEQYRDELTAVIDSRRNHPSIIMWVPFNEGWGQFDTADIVCQIQEYDPTRLVNAASGWTDRGVGDVHDEHWYPGPRSPKIESGRAAVLGEFGGLGLPLDGRTWQSKANWGYRSYERLPSLGRSYVELIDRLRPLVWEGLCAAVYTQTSDVEVEVNGLMTYDRSTLKIDEASAVAAHRRLSLPPPTVRELVPTAEKAEVVWRYSTETPPDDWMIPEFEEEGEWSTASAGFGDGNPPDVTPRTKWSTPNIWLRRTVDLPAAPAGRVYLRVYHDDDAEVFINSRFAARLDGWTIRYMYIPVREPAARTLRPGANLIAVHCRQSGGAQFIDVGLVEMIEQE